MGTEQEKARQTQLLWGKIVKIYVVLYCILSAGLVVYVANLLASL